MCGRYRNKLTFSDLRGLTNSFLVRPDPAAAPNMEPNLDVRPTTQQWVIRQTEDGAEAVKMRWGLVPYCFKVPSLKEFKLTTFNAKAETVATAASAGKMRQASFKGLREDKSARDLVRERTT